MTVKKRLRYSIVEDKKKKKYLQQVWENSPDCSESSRMELPVTAWHDPVDHGQLRNLEICCNWRHTNDVRYEQQHLGRYPSTLRQIFQTAKNEHERWDEFYPLAVRNTLNTLSGRGIFLLAANVFNSPGKRVVRATWNSNVFGFETWTAGTEWSGCLSLSLKSSLEQRENVKASVKPAWASCSLSWSDNLFIGYWEAIV